MKNLVLTKEIIIDAPASKVWSSLTNVDDLKKYLFGCEVMTDWRVGSPILFKGNWNGRDFIDKGTILDFQKEKTYQYNYWSAFSGLPDAQENYSLIRFEIEGLSERTLLRLTQSNFVTTEMYEHSDKNWDETLETLKNVLENTLN